METIKKAQVKRIFIIDHVNFIAAVFCFWFAIYIYSPIFSVYLEASGFSYSEIGIILGGYGITQILLRFPLGILTDFLYKYSKYLFVSGFIASLVSCLLLVYFDSFFMILTARLLVGVTASMWVMATVLYTYYFSAGQSPRAMGTMQFVMVASQFFSMAISGYLVDLFDWNFPFWVGVVASLFGAFFALNIKVLHVEKGPSVPLNMMSYFKKIIVLPQLKMLTFLSLIAHVALFVTIFGFSPIMAAELGVPEKSFIWLICAFFVPHALASLILVFYKLDSRYHKWILAICFGVTTISLVFVPFTNSLFSLSAVHILIGLALGLIFPILLSDVAQIGPADLKMSVMGFYQSFYALGIFFGPLVAGLIAEKLGLNHVFYFTGFLSFLAGVIVTFKKRK